MKSIPVLDLNQPVEVLGAELRRAFTEVGFYFVRNHGVTQELLDTTFAEAERFHAMPLEDKLALKVDQHNIGYIPMRGTTTRINAVGDIARPNVNESVFFRRDLGPDHPDVVQGLRFRGQNQWPQLPGFRENIRAICDAFEGLGKRLLPLYAHALDLPGDYFAPFFTEPMYALRLAHYPQQAPMAPENEFGSSPHLDVSFMTILAQNRVPGLSLQLPDGSWLDAPAPEGALLINGGMQMQRWTAGRFRAAPHRVINRSGGERYAMPFFMDASYRAVMTPITLDGQPGVDRPITYAEFMEQFQRANFHHAQDMPLAQAQAERKVLLGV